MATCPYCSNQLLRHIRSNQTYWFCRHCWEEMSDADLNHSHSFSISLLSNLVVRPKETLELTLRQV